MICTWEMSCLPPCHPQKHPPRTGTCYGIWFARLAIMSLLLRKKNCIMCFWSTVMYFLSNDGLGCTSLSKHRINTGDSLPIHIPPRRIPHAHREEVRKLLQDMLAKLAIQPSDSPWSSPIVLVTKTDGSTRFCMDYRKVNTVTSKDAYPLPRVDDPFGTLAGSKLFSTLDLATGYWQVEVADEVKEKTAFLTPEGLYQFEVMPFELCNALATFPTSYG